MISRNGKKTELVIAKVELFLRLLESRNDIPIGWHKRVAAKWLELKGLMDE